MLKLALVAATIELAAAVAAAHYDSLTATVVAADYFSVAVSIHWAHRAHSFKTSPRATVEMHTNKGKNRKPNEIVHERAAADVTVALLCSVCCIQYRTICCANAYIGIVTPESFGAALCVLSNDKILYRKMRRRLNCKLFLVNE